MRGWAALAGLALISPAVGAEGNTESQLDSALRDAQIKQYERAIGKVRKLLDGLVLNTVEEIIRAHKILGVSYCEIGQQPEATQHFDALVTFSPNETIADLVRTKPCSELYAGIQAAAKTGEPGSARTPAPAVPPPPLSGGVRPESGPGTPAPVPVRSPAGPETWKRLIPYGVGQFANGQGRKGMAFLATEAAATALGVTSFVLFKREENSNGTFRDPDRASLYRDLTWGSFGVGLAAAVWGIVDAVYVYRHSPPPPKRAWHWNGTALAFQF